jgi:sugar phosphate isomerase/epimerase
MSAPSRRDLLLAGAAAAVAPTAGVASRPAVAAPRYRLGIVTYNVAAAWDLDTLLKICQTVGLSAVECRTTHKHGVEPTLTRDQRRDVKAKFAASGVQFWGCGSVCEFQSADPAVVRKNVEDCKQFVQLVADLGGKGVKVRPNGLPKENVPLEKTLEQIGKALIDCGKAGADAGIEIWVEVHGRTTCEPQNMKTIMEHCGHPAVGLTWNSNPEDVKGGSVAESFRLLRPWVRSCHINDLYKDQSKQYPYRELFRLLRDADYDRVTLCEVGRTFADPTLGTEFLRYYKALWNELAGAAG